MRIANYITADPNVCHGKPCFKGTRVMVATILELLEAGTSPQEIRKGYPTITPVHIRAALHVAHQLLEQGHTVTFTRNPHAISR